MIRGLMRDDPNAKVRILNLDRIGTHVIEGKTRVEGGVVHVIDEIDTMYSIPLDKVYRIEWD